VVTCPKAEKKRMVVVMRVGGAGEEAGKRKGSWESSEQAANQNHASTVTILSFRSTAPTSTYTWPERPA
jgi:hypothetical protein